MAGERWTEAEIRHLHSYLRRGMKCSEIAAAMGKTRKRIEARIRIENDEKRSANIQRTKEWHRKRREAGIPSKQRVSDKPKTHVTPLKKRPTTEMLEEARRRLEIPRSITSEFFGDPPKGYSALDKRGIENGMG
jgi:hypothetical protein